MVRMELLAELVNLWINFHGINLARAIAEGRSGIIACAGTDDENPVATLNETEWNIVGALRILLFRAGVVGQKFRR